MITTDCGTKPASTYCNPEAAHYATRFEPVETIGAILPRLLVRYGIDADSDLAAEPPSAAASDCVALAGRLSSAPGPSRE